MSPNNSFELRVSSSELEEQAKSRSPFNWKLETGNSKLRERGFSIITAVFLLVVLAMLGAFMLSVTGIQQSSSVLDVQGARAYQAARAGVEWGAWQVLDPNNAIGTPALPTCPASPTNLSALGGSLSPFAVTVTCTATSTTEGNRNLGAYLIVVTACNQPSGGSCPNATPSAGYLERQMQAALSKCKDPSASGPRFECG
jgi:MSHA biogenesis protein MshP